MIPKITTKNVTLFVSDNLLSIDSEFVAIAIIQGYSIEKRRKDKDEYLQKLVDWLNVDANLKRFKKSVEFVSFIDIDLLMLNFPLSLISGTTDSKSIDIAFKHKTANEPPKFLIQIAPLLFAWHWLWILLYGVFVISLAVFVFAQKRKLAADIEATANIDASNEYSWYYHSIDGKSFIKVTKHLGEKMYFEVFNEDGDMVKSRPFHAYTSFKLNGQIRAFLTRIGMDHKFLI